MMWPPHQSLPEQLERLETEQEENAEAITEVRRRIEVLDEVTSWSVTEEEPKEEFPLVDGLPKEKEYFKRNFAPLLVSGMLVILLAIAIAFSGYYYYVIGKWRENATQLQSQLVEQQTFYAAQLQSQLVEQQTFYAAQLQSQLVEQQTLLGARISEPSDESLGQNGDSD